MVKIIELKTTQSSAIKILVDTLNSLLTDVNITFYPTHDTNNSDDSEYDDSESSNVNSEENNNEKKASKKGGIIIKEVNKTITVLVYCKLDGFEEYKYNYHKNKLMIGVKLPNLLKCLKCMTHFDTMSWIIEEEDMNKLVVILESTERNEKKIFKLNLMDLDDEKYEIEPVTFPYCITMPSQDFHKYCKDMASVMANKMDIQTTSNMVFLSGKSDIGSVDFQVGESIGGLQIDVNTDKNEIVQGNFELKYLTIFTKCTNLCNEVKLFLKNDYALVVRYQVAALGEIKLVLSPSEPEN
jgi:proliferating cell nuclear antigen